MSLITAHRILISAAIVMFALYSVLELRNFAQTGEGGAVVRAFISGAAVVGWALYLRTVNRKYRSSPTH